MDEAAGKSTQQVMRMLAEVDPELVVPADRVRALSGGRWELKAVIDDECQRGLEQLNGLLSHVDPRSGFCKLFCGSWLWVKRCCRVPARVPRFVM